MTEAQGDTPGQHLRPAERRVLAGVMVAGSLVPLNSTMIAVALPDIGRDLDVSDATAATLVTTYLVAMLACQPAAGRIGDRWGTATTARAALAGFTVASALASAAPTFPALLVGRCAQALFAAALIPNGQALLRRTVTGERRGKAFGFVGTGIGAGAAIGPVLGGVLVGGAGWQAMFLANVPLALSALLLLGPASVPAVTAETAGDDVAGLAPARGWRIISRNRPFAAACAVQATSNAATYTVLLVVPIVLVGRGWSTGAVGASLSCLTVGMLALAPVGGRWGDRVGRTRPVVTGMTVMAVSTAVLAAFLATPPVMVAALLAAGIGNGLSGASLQSGALEAVPATVSATAAGLLSTSRYVGSIAASTAIAAAGVAGTTSARPVMVGATAAAVLAVLAATNTGARPRLTAA